MADVYDALTTPRPYKPAFTHQHAVQLISEERGRRFDPDALDAFMSLGKEFDAIRRTYADEANR